jgi:putative sterol carrier protein
MDVAREVRDLFDRRTRDPFEPRLAGVLASYRFDVAGVGSFRVRVDDGKLQIEESTDEADCVIACEAQDFVRIASGAQNLLTAAMQGLVTVHGDLALAQRLHGLLP